MVPLGLVQGEAGQESPSGHPSSLLLFLLVGGHLCNLSPDLDPGGRRTQGCLDLRGKFRAERKLS